MKRCPFCAEQIQDAAIKCRWCGSFLSATPDDLMRAAQGIPPKSKPTPAALGVPAAQGVPVEEPPPSSRAAGSASRPRAASPVNDEDGIIDYDEADERPLGGVFDDREVLYAGTPSWRAFFWPYVNVVVGTLLGTFIVNWIAKSVGASLFSRFLAIVLPVGIGGLFFFGVDYYRRSLRFRIDTKRIETESGIIRRKIDVLELFRIKRMNYRQSFIDKLLGISTYEIFTSMESETPELEIPGAPPSRQLFERLQKSIDYQQRDFGVDQPKRGLHGGRRQRYRR